MLKILLAVKIFAIMSLMQKLSAQDIAGEYYIKGNHEMVAAFKFDADSSFEFYFVYGAVDRTAKGTYTVNGKNILLKSDKPAGHDFTVTMEKISGQGSTVKFTDKNQYLQKSIACVFIKGKQEEVVYSDAKGIAHSSLSECDSIIAVHMLFPDAPTAIKSSSANKNNYFEATLNPSLAAVSFKDFVLTKKDDSLVGSLPYLFESEQSVFVKK